MECWAEHWGGDEAKRLAPAIYWVVLYVPISTVVAFLVVVAFVLGH